MVFRGSFLAAVAKLVGIIRTEVSIAPNVELKGKMETFNSQMMKTNNHNKQLELISQKMNKKKTER